MIPRPGSGLSHVETLWGQVTCEDVGSYQPGPGGQTNAGQQSEGVQGQAVQNDELDNIGPNCQN